MAGTQRTVPYLEGKFETGDIPEQADFYDFFASFIHYLQVKQVTGSSLTDIMSQKAVTDAINSAITSLVNASPATLDTLNEIAAAIGNDPNFAATLTASIALKAPIASPTFTGTPAAPTPTPGDNTTKLATTAFLQAAITALNLDERLKTLAHSAVVLLDKNYKVTHTIAGAIAYTKSGSTHIVGNVRQDFLTANGANKPTFSSDFVVAWDNWVNTNGTLNVVRFEYLSNGKIQVDLRNI